MERRAIAISGTIQGVGFRPFVHGLASRLELGGCVRNHTGGVAIEVEGDPHRLDEFLNLLVTHPPPLARIDELSWKSAPICGDAAFRIEPSECDNHGTVVIPPDIATCDQCLAELFDPTDRRFGYPFLNCTKCGPRLTIINAAPYDRSRTSMAPFPMCAACRNEYEDPGNRRFHAQPTACPACGPRLTAVDPGGDHVASGSEALDRTVAMLVMGKLAAIKGLGGYHLACDARSPLAVSQLRQRKNRDEKPFAVMVPSIDAARALCDVNDSEATLLSSPARPIVLLRKLGRSAVAEAVAPGNPFLGVMLPYTPLHHLLLHDLGPDAVLVMTSGNRSDEPIAYKDDDARERLAKIADIFLIHDRAIHVRCDDSVWRVIDGQESPIRRSRGYAPRPIALPVACGEPVLAVGGQLKATFALGRDRQAVLSHHAGDLDNYEAYRAFERDITLYEQLFRVTPKVIALDLHPDYASTRYALRRAAAEGLEVVAVQHHHAHLASCMADNGLVGDVIGVTFDGTGYGSDGNVWGGEFLVGGYEQFRRAAHLRYVAMPGGDRAIREPWRMALAHLADADLGDRLLRQRVAHASLRTAGRMLDRGFNAPLTSSAGRLFDAVASIAGVRDCVSYEGQAAMQLEWLATGAGGDAGTYPFEVAHEQIGDVIDTRPLIRAAADDIARGTSAAIIARRFHSTMVEIIASVCKTIARDSALDRVVLSGGVFMNALLTREAAARLEADGFRVYRHRLVPPNDGGLSLGQLAIVAAQVHRMPREGVRI
ncbi:MAG: carbamoyltransferase HypF [Tepidisphaeraceae bacterium]